MRRAAVVAIVALASSRALGQATDLEAEKRAIRIADLDPRHDPFAWRLWSFGWTPRRSGTIRVTARATDSRGSVQPREAVWNPGGFLHNGWDSVEVVVAGQAVR